MNDENIHTLLFGNLGIWLKNHKLPVKWNTVSKILFLELHPPCWTMKKINFVILRCTVNEVFYKYDI